jgi:hypothetical protein
MNYPKAIKAFYMRLTDDGRADRPGDVSSALACGSSRRRRAVARGWWQRGDTPRGLRDVGYQSAWIIGAVCPARDTGVALVMTRLDTAAMNLFLAELRQAVAPVRMALC